MAEKSDSKKQRILFITTGLNIGGAELFLQRLVSGIKGEFQIAIISLSGGGAVATKIRDLDTIVYELNFKRIFFLPICLYDFFSIIHKFKPDVIHGWMSHGNLLAFFAKFISSRKSRLFFGVRQSLSRFSQDKKSTLLVIFLVGIVSKFVDKIIYNSYAGKSSHEKHGYCRKNGVVICNGVDTEFFRPAATNHNLICDEMQIDRDSFLVGIIARFHPVKDHSTFICAASSLAAMKNNAHFVMSGFGVDDNNTHLKELINSYPSLKKRVHLLGLRNDMAYITSALDVATNCSLSEGFANALCEALACGVICVATDVGDAKKIIGDAGFVVSPGSPNDLANVWWKIMEMSKDERERYKVLARERALQYYSMNNVIAKYKKELLPLCDQLGI